MKYLLDLFQIIEYNMLFLQIAALFDKTAELKCEDNWMRNFTIQIHLDESCYCSVQKENKTDHFSLQLNNHNFLKNTSVYKTNQTIKTRHYNTIKANSTHSNDSYKDNSFAMTDDDIITVYISPQSKSLKGSCGATARTTCRY